MRREVNARVKRQGGGGATATFVLVSSPLPRRNRLPFSLHIRY